MVLQFSPPAKSGITGPRERFQAEVDEQGHLCLPAAVATRLGLRPGARLLVEALADGFRLGRSLTHLAKVYVEPTNGCNLACRTCIRHAWNEPQGQMESSVFERVMTGLATFSPPPVVFFGGFGEPLAHPDIVDMVAQMAALGGSVELITNGILLSADMSQRLIAAGLDMLWVSLDGATPESYADVRLRQALPEILANLASFRDAAEAVNGHQPRLGIAFVAMKRNIADLPALLDLGSKLGATHFLVSNVLPYTAEMCDEVLYSSALADAPLYGHWQPRLALPLMDATEVTREPVYQALRRQLNVSIGASELSSLGNHCPFVESGAMAIGWDGSVSPCLPLLHDYTNFLNGHQRYSRRYVLGNVAERDLAELWNTPEHLAFRQRVSTFDFAPCVSCGVCHLAETNEDDCFGSGFPSCGGCPWAQGVIQCP